MKKIFLIIYFTIFSALIIHGENMNIGNTGYYLIFPDNLLNESYSGREIDSYEEILKKWPDFKGIPTFLIWYPIGNENEWLRIPFFEIKEMARYRDSEGNAYLGALYFSDSIESPLRDEVIHKKIEKKVLNNNGICNIYVKNYGEYTEHYVYYAELIVYDIDIYIHIITWGYSEENVLWKLDYISNIDKNSNK